MANPKVKQKKQKVEPHGKVYVLVNFNNTIVTFTDLHGNAIASASAGGSGFRGSRKSTPFAAQVTVEKAGAIAREAGMTNIDVIVKGPGAGRDSALRALAAFKIKSIKDETPIPHNGVRVKKRRRV